MTPTNEPMFTVPPVPFFPGERLMFDMIPGIPRILRAYSVLETGEWASAECSALLPPNEAAMVLRFNLDVALRSVLPRKVVHLKADPG